MSAVSYVHLESMDQHISSAEAAIALRQRLNEIIEQLETLRREHAELEIKFDTASQELTIAKSDCESTIIVCGP